MVTSVLERGNIYFAYRPRVGGPAVRGIADVQRLYMILSPSGSGVHRLLVIGAKRLPVVNGDDRTTWSFVDKVATHAEDVQDALDPLTDPTPTQGPRHVASARPAGEGVYALARHGEHTHLAYALKLPAQSGEVQQALNIAREASCVATVKNPEAPSPPGVGLEAISRATMPDSLMQRFGGRRFIPVDPPELLDCEGVELVLIGARARVAEGLGLALEPEHETAATAEIFSQLKLELSVHPLAPLFEGKWE